MNQEKETQVPDPIEYLGKFNPLDSRLDHLLIQFGPLWVLAQVNITGVALILTELYYRITGNPQAITWAVLSPAYVAVFGVLLIESIAIRNFLLLIPRTFKRLWEDGILGQQKDSLVAIKFRIFLDGFEHKLNRTERLFLGIPFAVLGLVFFWVTGHLRYCFQILLSDNTVLTKLMVVIVNTSTLFIPAVVIGYAIGIGTWKSIVTGRYVRHFSRTFALSISASHPDKAGGLKPLGNLMLAVAALLIIASLALSGITIIAGYVAYYNTEFFSKLFLGIVIALSLIVFFLPLISAHERMVSEKEQFEPVLIEINHRISDLESSTRINLAQMDFKQRQDIFAEIDSLKELYKRTTNVPTWPFDRDIFVRLATPQIISLLSLTGLANPIVSAINSFINVLTSSRP